MQRRDATGVDTLRGLTLTRVGERTAESTITASDELFDVLDDLFGLSVDEIGSAARAALWDKVRTAHEAWETAGRP